MANLCSETIVDEQRKLVISTVKQVLPGCYKITTGEGPVIFMRVEYLKQVLPERLISESVFWGDDADDIVAAGFAFNAEQKAVAYLSRCEQCRFGLEQKLLSKGYNKNTISQALDFLTNKNLLDDSRFARSWLRIHIISNIQGRKRLFLELLSRGINKDIAAAALDDFYEQYDEADLCRKACVKCLRIGKKGDKLIKYLIAKGFSYQMIKTILSNYDECVI